MKRVFLVVFLLAFFGIVAAGILMVRRGFSAREEPSTLEAAVARTIRHLAIPAEARHAVNLAPATSEVIDSARAHFADHCAGCHGNDGKGQTEMGRNLYPKTPDMTALATQSLTDGEIFWIIKNGVRLTGMPAWGDDSPGSDRASWELVRFIRHLPQITPDELEQMEDLNPVSPHAVREREEIDRFLRGEEASPEKNRHPH